jgi:ATP-dependent Clp protease protease subunit
MMRESIYSVENNNTVMDEGDVIFHRWDPTFIEESSSGMHAIPLRTKHFTDRKLFIIGEVTDEMANDFVSEFLYLAQSDEPIDIYINSPGGSVDAGLVIYDVIQACKDKVTINMYCIGMAASMGAVILAGGQKGHRYILPHSSVMIHEPLISGGMGGSASSIKKTADSILETKAIINGILSEHTGKTLKEINKATSFDNYMNAEEAIKFGLCDEIRNIF